jgi:uncharacterized protein
VHTLLIIIAILLSIVGIIGCFIPTLPGTPLNYIAMWLIQWAFHPFTLTALIIYGVLTIVILVLDYFMPVMVAKRYGATRQGIIGSMIGMVIGFFFTPVGMILGIIAGAIIGDMIGGRSPSQATRSGIATFAGTLLSIGLKLLLSGVITGLIAYELVKRF